MAYYLEIILVVILIAFSAFSAMSEAALLSINRFKVRHWVEKKRIGAHYVQKLKDDPARLLTTLLIANNLVNTAVAVIITAVSINTFHSNAIGIATGIATFLILVFGDIIPKSIGANNNELLAPFVAPIIWYVSFVFQPLVKLLNMLLNEINRLFGTKKTPIITKEEIKSIVRASEESGSIKEIEKKIVQRVFDFENTTVGDVMTPKRLMVSVDAKIKIKDVLQIPSTKLYSRFPVYENNKESIIGILYLKDVISYIKDNKMDVTVKEIMRKPFFVFTSKKMDTMLKLFQGKKQHMAIVIDEKGHIAGVVTIENILEEIVGEIIDESDRLNPSIVPINRNEWIVKGSAEIEEVNAKIGIGVKVLDYVDLDSFISATLGRVPKFGDEVNFKGFKILIEEVQGKKVLKARLLKMA